MSPVLSSLTVSSLRCDAGQAGQQLPPAGQDVRSRGKRMAVKFLNKMGTKDRFNNPDAAAQAGRQQQRKPAYSPEAFENLGAKGKNLANRWASDTACSSCCSLLA